MSDYVGTKYTIAFNSGTSALHALLYAYDIKQGDEVIVPSFTFISTANAPLFVGAKPVFAEIEDKTYGLDPEDVKERITSKTKAIMPIHYGGSPCLIKELKEIAEDHNLLLIEDAAESLGAKIGNEMVGTFGDATMFSFCQNKIISTGEGGAISTDSKEIYDKLKLIISHGRSETQDYFSSIDNFDYVGLGYNFRMSTLTAALGVSQIEKIDDIIQMRRDKAEYMSEKLSDISDIKLPTPMSNYHHVYQMYPIMVSDKSRDGLIEHLSNSGIMTKIYFSPVHLTSFYKNTFGYDIGDYPVTEMIYNQILSLPIYPTLEYKEIDYISKCIKQYFEG